MGTYDMACYRCRSLAEIGATAEIRAVTNPIDPPAIVP